MNYFAKNTLLEILINLVKVPGISGTSQERAMGDKIWELLEEIPYFQKNPGHLYSIAVPSDPFSRYSIGALLKGSQKKTVILLNHLDVVDVLDYGDDKDLAFFPYELTKTYAKRSLPKEARKDLEGGDYLFGRGVADMKGGIALQLSLLYELSQESLPGNILFLSVCDEEGSSLGILSALPFLKQLQEAEGLDYLGVINCEPIFPAYEGDTNRYIYTGSIGKALAFFSFYGQETHAGDPLAGLNANLMASKLTSLLEGNIDFCDGEKDLLSPPPTCLKQKDLKRLYSAQIPHHAVSYFNMPLVHRGPEELLRRLKRLAFESLTDLQEDMNEKRRRYYWEKDIDYTPTKWKPEVYLFSEIQDMVKKRVGEVEMQEALSSLYEEKRESLNLQDLSLKLVHGLYGLMGKKEPMIILGFLPPYYPPVTNADQGTKEEFLLKGIKDLISFSFKEYQEKLCLTPFFPGLSDLSYFSLESAQDLLDFMVPNLPGYGLGYSLPLSTMASLHIPVVNLGVLGKDVHQYTERIGLHYSLKVLPPLLQRLVLHLLKGAYDAGEEGI